MSKNKTLIAFLILFLLIAAFLAVVYIGDILSYTRSVSNFEQKAGWMLESILDLNNHIESIENRFSKKTAAVANLMSMSLGHFVTENGYNGPEAFEDGLVVRNINGRMVYPKDSPIRFPDLTDADTLADLPPLTAERITGDGEERIVLITTKPIAADLYYIDWAETDDYAVFRRSDMSESYFSESVAALEEAFGICMIMIDEQTSGSPLLYASDEFGSPETIEDLGISGDSIGPDTENLFIEGQYYKTFYDSLQILKKQVGVLILVNDYKDNAQAVICQLISVLFLLLDIGGVILYIHWVNKYIQDHQLNERQEKDYQPDRLRERFIFRSIIDAILLLVLLGAYQYLGNLSRISDNNKKAVDILKSRIETSKIQDAAYKEDEESWELFCAKRIADLYAAYPELQNREYIIAANQLLGSEYIMIFDTEGVEIMSSNAYTGFTLGKEIASTKDYRYLLQGIDHIIVEPEKERFTEKILQTVGARLDLGEEDGYGAIMLAFDPQTSWESDVKLELTDFIDRITPDKNLSIIIENQSNTVFYSDNQTHYNRSSEDIGLDRTDLVPTSLATFKILGEKYFGAYDKDAQYEYYFLIKASYLTDGVAKYALFSAFYYLFASIAICMYLLGPGDAAAYKQTVEKIKKIDFKPKYDPKKNKYELLQVEELSTQPISERWALMNPEQKIVHVTQIVITVFLASAILLLISGKVQIARSVSAFVLKGNWERGVNELAFVAIMVVLFILFIFIFLKNMLLKALCKVMNPRSETIGHLVASMLHYIAIIASVFFCLSYLGFDAQVLLTSAGILSLAISLGSKDLVADILAGVFIIFEGDFHVGDIIEVNGFKGRVTDIGVRNTKLRDSNNNIKIIDNQSIKDILNMSKENSWCTVVLTISDTQPLSEIEEMFKRELPKVGQRIPQIIDGPYYIGITEISYRRINIGLRALGRQDDIKVISGMLNHEIWDLFEKYGYQL